MRFASTHARRALAGGAAGVVGLALFPAGAGAVVSTEAFCANVPAGQSGFTDIGNTAPHTRNIECLKGSGVTSGTSATTYTPLGNVTRGQMATFIANMLDRAAALDAPAAPTLPTLPSAADSADAFTDDEGNTHEANINRLAEAEIVSGTSATTFSPNDNVTRGQMASFIAQALAFVRGAPLPEGDDAFADDEGNTHEANINRLATAEIVAGTSATTFNPGGLVSRAQMASFVIQAMADLHADGFITPIPASAAGLSVTPTTVQSVEPVTTDSAPNPDVASDNRTYTATGLDQTKTYRVTLFQTSNISGSGSNVTFADAAPNDNVADQGAAIAQIITVNGTATTAAQSVGGITPVNGEITFVIDATAVNGSNTPVVFVDGGATTHLDLDAADKPTDVFGMGGAFVTTPPEAAIGAQPGAVTFVNAAGEGGSFTSATARFDYDANDTFRYQGAGITMAQFETILSAGDTVAGTSAYNPDPTGASTFDLTTDAAPPAPTNVQAAVSGGNDVTVSFTPAPGTATGATFQLQRATVTPAGDCGPTGGDDPTPADGAFADVGTPVASSPASQNDVPAGCYAYRVITINPTSNVESAGSTPTGSVTIA